MENAMVGTIIIFGMIIIIQTIRLQKKDRALFEMTDVKDAMGEYYIQRLALADRDLHDEVKRRNVEVDGLLKKLQQYEPSPITPAATVNK